jgi:hypothetical protein
LEGFQKNIGKAFGLGGHDEEESLLVFLGDGFVRKAREKGEGRLLSGPFGNGLMEAIVKSAGGHNHAGRRAWINLSKSIEKQARIFHGVAATDPENGGLRVEGAGRERRGGVSIGDCNHKSWRDFGPALLQELSLMARLCQDCGTLRKLGQKPSGQGGSALKTLRNKVVEIGFSVVAEAKDDRKTTKSTQEENKKGLESGEFCDPYTGGKSGQGHSKSKNVEEILKQSQNGVFSTVLTRGTGSQDAYLLVTVGLERGGIIGLSKDGGGPATVQEGIEDIFAIELRTAIAMRLSSEQGMEVGCNDGKAKSRKLSHS